MYVIWHSCIKNLLEENIFRYLDLFRHEAFCNVIFNERRKYFEDRRGYVSNRLSLDNSCLAPTRSTPINPIHDSSASNDLLISCCTLNTLHSSGPELKNISDRNDAQILSELISHCGYVTHSSEVYRTTGSTGRCCPDSGFCC